MLEKKVGSLFFGKLFSDAFQMFAVKRSVFEFERESGVRPYPNIDIYICLIYVCKGMLVYTLRVVSHNAFCVVGAQLVSVKTNKGLLIAKQ